MIPPITFHSANPTIRTVPKTLYFANHAQVDAFTADVDLYGAVFPVHMVGQGLDTEKSGGSPDRCAL